MKLSIETKVASVVAAGFLAVTIGVVAQADGVSGIGESDNGRLMKDSSASSYTMQHEYDGSFLSPGSGTNRVEFSLGKNVDGEPDLSDL